LGKIALSRNSTTVERKRTGRGKEICKRVDKGLPENCVTRIKIMTRQCIALILGTDGHTAVTLYDLHSSDHRLSGRRSRILFFFGLVVTI